MKSFNHEKVEDNLKVHIASFSFLVSKFPKYWFNEPFSTEVLFQLRWIVLGRGLMKSFNNVNVENDVEVHIASSYENDSAKLKQYILIFGIEIP